MNGIELFIGVFTKLLPLIIPVVVIVTIGLYLERHRPSDKDPLECDMCGSFFDHDRQPAGSFQTYDGEWFCSDDCGRKAGW